MCIIILDDRTNKTDKVPFEQFERSAEKNPDGMGIMYAKDNVLQIWRTMDNIKELYNRYTTARDQKLRVAVHFRQATVGTATIDNVHPFEIMPGLAFMHNGTIYEAKSAAPKGTSDTRFFNEELLSLMPRDFLSRPLLEKVLDKFIWQDRMLFMDNKGRMTIINEAKLGAKWKNGVWYSKDTHLEFILTGKEPVKSGFSAGSGSKSTDYSEWGTTGYWASYPKGAKTQRFIRYGSPEDIELQKEDGIIIDPVTGKFISRVNKDKSGTLGTTDKDYEGGELFFSFGLIDGLENLNDVYPAGTAYMPRAQLFATEDNLPTTKYASDPQTRIEGKLYYFRTGLHSCMSEWDQVVGCAIPTRTQPYRRSKREIVFRTPNGNERSLTAWAYMGNEQSPDFDPAYPVPFGDWEVWKSRWAREAVKSHKKSKKSKKKKSTPFDSDDDLNIEAIFKTTGEMSLEPCMLCGDKNTELFERHADKKITFHMWCHGCIRGYRWDTGETANA